MNNRFRQVVKAQLMVSRNSVLATLRGDDPNWLHMLVIPRNKINEWKEKYGDRLTIWEV